MSRGAPPYKITQPHDVPELASKASLLLSPITSGFGKPGDPVDPVQAYIDLQKCLNNCSKQIGWVSLGSIACGVMGKLPGTILIASQQGCYSTKVRRDVICNTISRCNST
jgi:hypothetical protein